MKFLIPIGLILALFCTPLKAQVTTNNAAKVHLKNASQKMKEAKFLEAAEYYKKALQYDGKNNELIYLTAMAYYRSEQYQKTINYVEPLLKKSNPAIKYFRIVGNSYDLLGQYEKGMSILREGLKWHPYDGEFHLDMGVIEMIKGNNSKAIEYWEAGIAAEPIMSDNYYWCTKMYARSNEKIWALYYGELFLNLSRNADERFYEISKIIHDVYMDIVNDRYSNKVEFTINRKVDNELEESSMVVFKKLRENDLLNTMRARNVEGGYHSLKLLSMVREDFLNLWSQIYGAKLKVNLLNRQKELQQKGYLKSYNYWLLSGGDDQEFMTYFNGQKMAYNQFFDWFIKNPMKIDITEFFKRSDYDTNLLKENPREVSKKEELIQKPPLPNPPEQKKQVEIPTKITENKTSTPSSNVESTKASKKVYQSFELDANPVYKKGIEDLQKYVSSRVDIPSLCIDRNYIFGEVIVSLVIDEKGKITETEVLKKNIDCGLDDSIIKTLSKMPAWKAGIKDNQYVASKIVIPFKFRLD